MLELTDFSWLVIAVVAFVSGFGIGNIYGSWKYGAKGVDGDE
jgi:hypothetical protein